MFINFFFVEFSPIQLPLIGMGAAIIAAFLALAGAAWSLDLPYFLAFNLFCSVYWSFIYLSIYIDIFLKVFERTTDMVKRAFTQKRKAILFFLKMSFLIASFFIFISFYQVIFPEMEKDNLVNPLQVTGQLCSFLLNFRYPLKPVWVRILLLLCFFLSLTSSLYLKGIEWEIISLLFFIFYLRFPLDYVQKIMFLVYFLEQGLAKWGFFMAFQQAAYCGLSFFLEKEESGPSSKKRLFSFFLLLLSQLFVGFVFYNDFYLKYFLNLAALFSGACIIFMSLKKRTKFQFLISFFIYFTISILIGWISAPNGNPTILGIHPGIFIFVFIHLWLFLGYFVFKDTLPGEKQPLVPLFFSGLFFLLCYFPDLAWLEKWIEGIDLLLLFLGIFSLLESDEIISKSRTKKEKKKEESQSSLKIEEERLRSD